MPEMMISAHGRLGQDPRPIETKSGTAMAVVSIAVNVPVGQGNDTATQWLGLVALGRLADQLLRHNRGDMVNVAGNVQVNRWTGKDGGEYEQLQVVVDSLLSARTTRPGGRKRNEQGVGSAQPEFDDEIPF